MSCIWCDNEGAPDGCICGRWDDKAKELVFKRAVNQLKNIVSGYSIYRMTREEAEAILRALGKR